MGLVATEPNGLTHPELDARLDQAGFRERRWQDVEWALYFLGSEGLITTRAPFAVSNWEQVQARLGHGHPASRRRLSPLGA